MTRILFALALVAVASSATAQPPECVLPATNPVNPTTVCFTVGIDHQSGFTFLLDLYDATDMFVQTISMGALDPDADGWVVWPSLNVMPTAFGTDYRARIRAVSLGSVESAASDPSNTWDRRPGRPGGVAVIQ